MNKFAPFAAIALFFAISSSAHAIGEGFSIKVGRDYKVTTNTGAVTSVSIGARARSDINVGGMQLEKTSVEIGRDYKVNVQAGAVTAVAIGADVSARINLGGIQSLQ